MGKEDYPHVGRTMMTDQLKLKSIPFWAILFSIFLFTWIKPAAAEEPSLPHITRGKVQTMGNGALWSWVETDNRGHPVSVGITFTETALSGLPENPPGGGLDGWEFPVELPSPKAVPPFTHIVVDWNPHGHIPPGIYDVPHFDFHFYLISSREREKITAKGRDLEKCLKKPESRFIPTGYMLAPGSEVPRMGAHWVDTASPEFHLQPFTRTFVYGSYDGRVAFLEPMVALSFLEAKTNSLSPVKLPVLYRKHGYYPISYGIKYDPNRREYTVSLEGLVKRGSRAQDR